MRGKHKSRIIDDLVFETELLASKGVKELIIIGQDTTDYGKDIYGKRNLAGLLEKISLVNGIEWIRLMYAYTSHFPDSITEMIAYNEKICKYIDIPLQHISDNVLKSMRRGITKRRTIELLETLKKKIPDIALRTTFISGYPNESEKDFEELCSFVKDFEFDRFGVFNYSPEENTFSYDLGDPIPDEVKEDRKATLMEIHKDISEKKNEKYVGGKLKVLIDGFNKDYYFARSERDAPEVDCEVLIETGNKKYNIGDFYTAEIVDYNEYDLIAK
jgi:ribosomal protein S12 methylthiotransferase